MMVTCNINRDLVVYYIDYEDTYMYGVYFMTEHVRELLQFPYGWAW